MTRASRATVLAMFIAGAVASPIGGQALGRACAAGVVRVAVVVDGGSDGPVSAVCVPGGSSDNGATILAARASMLGTAQPRYSSSGLLCAIDGVPETGCGIAHSGHYSYWSYWHGHSGKWSYSNIGPASTRVNAAIVEGWRWQPDGSALPTDPPPRGPADATAVCTAPPPPTRAPTTTRSTLPPSTGVTGPSPVGAQQTPTTLRLTPRASTHIDPTTTLVHASTAPTSARAGPPPSTSAPGPLSTSPSIGLTNRGIAAPVTHTSEGKPIGLVAGVVLVVALGAGGAIAARRRRRSAP